MSPVDPRSLTVGLCKFVKVTLTVSVCPMTLLSGRIFLPAAHSALDALVVEVRVVLRLELGQDVLQLLHLRASLVSLRTNLDQRSPQFFDPALGQLSKDVNLAGLLAPHDLALLLSRVLQTFLETRIDLLHLELRRLELHLQFPNVILRLLLLPAGIHQHRPLLLQRRRHRPLPLLLLPPPLLPDPLAPVLALRGPNPRPLVAAIAAYLVVTHPVIDPLERNVRRPMALVLAVEPRQRRRELQLAAPRPVRGSER